MLPSLKSLGIDQMSRDERLVLVQEIWDTIAKEPEPLLVTEAQRQELERRVAEDDAAPDDVVSWEEVKARTAARLRQ